MYVADGAQILEFVSSLSSRDVGTSASQGKPDPVAGGHFSRVLPSLPLLLLAFPFFCCGDHIKAISGFCSENFC